MTTSQVAILLLLASLSLANLTSDPEDSSDYSSWKEKHGKAYDEREDRYRLFLFRQKQSEIKAHNENPSNRYKKAENQFSAETDE